MAIVATKFLDAEFAWAVSTTSRNFSSIAPTGNLLYVAGVLVENPGSAWDSEPTLSGGGMTSWTRQLSVDLEGVFKLFVFSSVTASPGSGVLIFTRGGSNDVFSWTGVSVVEVTGSVITGTNGSNAFIQTESATQDDSVASATTVSLDGGGFATGNGGLAFFTRFRVDSGQESSTPRSGWSEIEDELSGDVEPEMAVHWRDNSDTAAVATYGSSGYKRVAAALEIAADASSDVPAIFEFAVG